jgi:hypothetical protein
LISAEDRLVKVTAGATVMVRAEVKAKEVARAEARARVAARAKEAARVAARVREAARAEARVREAARAEARARVAAEVTAAHSQPFQLTQTAGDVLAVVWGVRPGQMPRFFLRRDFERNLVVGHIGS